MGRGGGGGTDEDSGSDGCCNCVSGVNDLVDRDSGDSGGGGGGGRGRGREAFDPDLELVECFPEVSRSGGGST